MTVEIRRASGRFLTRSRGRETRHAFSFGEHFDPDRLRFGSMVCQDDHRLANGQGYDEHPHRDLQIVTWVLTGSLEHRDSLGGSSLGEPRVLGPGTVQVLTAGTGVTHSEVAASAQTRFVQVWLTPDDTGLAPSCSATPVDLPAGSLVEVATPTATATFWVARLDAGQSLTLPEHPLQHVFVARGALTRSSLAEPLADGDAFVVTDDPALQVTAAVPTEILVWTFATPAPAMSSAVDAGR